MRLKDPVIVGEDVALAYGSTIALSESSFEIPRGGLTILIGPNGSGKSSLLNLVAGLLPPTSGTIQVSPSDGRVPRISYVLQTTRVNDALPITVREVVTMGRFATVGSYGWLDADDRGAVDSAMKRMDIDKLADRHLRDLSGGQRQRVFVAQGLAQEHDLLLLDEPLTGLDLTSARAIDDVIHDEYNDGCTIVMTTHDLVEAHVADHVVLLSGRVVAFGPPDQVLTVENLTAAYGPNLLHVEGESLFLDDPAHRPVGGRHVHRDRSN